MNAALVALATAWPWAIAGLAGGDKWCLGWPFNGLRLDHSRYTKIHPNLGSNEERSLFAAGDLFFPAGIVEPRFDKTPFKSTEQL